MPKLATPYMEQNLEFDVPENSPKGDFKKLNMKYKDVLNQVFFKVV